MVSDYLSWNVPIVDGNGYPSPQLIRFLQHYQNSINGNSNDITQKVDQSRRIDTTAPLAGGGDLTADRTLSLTDTAVTPGTYGDATHVGQFTVDQKGRITAASNVTVSGGGGGGHPWYFAPPHIADFPTTIGSVAPIVADNSNVGLTYNFGTLVAGDTTRGIAKATPGAVNWQVTAHITGGISNVNFSNMGLGVTDSARSKSIEFRIDGRNFLYVGEVSLPSGFIADRATPAIAFFSNPFLRITYTAATSTYSFDASADGVVFFNVFAYSTALLGTPGYVFIGARSARTTGAPIQLSCDSWNQSW